MKRIIIIFALIIGLTGCQKLFFKKNNASVDPQENFEYLWQELKDKYSYFQVKNINWEAVHTQYQNQIHPGMSESELFEVLKKMLFELKDDHSNLVSAFDVSVYNIYAQYPKNFNDHLIYQLFPNIHRTGPFAHSWITGKNIAYVRYGSFMSMFSEEQLDYVLDMYKSSQGLIFDIRENGGGVLLNVPSILSRFTEQELLIGYSKTKIGPEVDDFGDLEPFNIKPSERIKYTKPIVVLIDRGSYSASTFFAAATKAFNNITLVGVPTGGGAGLPHGGQLPNGWTFRFSISQFLYPNMDASAEFGVQPDVPWAFDWTDMTKDVIIDKAVEILE
ncbi:MAG: S41 family peptidase [Brumimicrobium sp.]|nr:S41 family peptidase [Brumimicrobium sp.]